MERGLPERRLGRPLVDRFIHRAEVTDIEADSYRLEEAKERNAARVKRRGRKPP